MNENESSTISSAMFRNFNDVEGFFFRSRDHVAYRALGFLPYEMARNKILSHFSNVPICVNNISYSSVEQAYQYLKATFANEHEIAERIMNEMEPLRMKKFASGIKDAKWDTIKFWIMFALDKHKVS
uniref:NADAR domain-containing protein n=1 Tax=Romanomermis culicivorax TaxID=13658 RepID=A0A915L1D8_ROMCU